VSFQTNSTLLTALWIWQPPAGDNVNQSIVVNLNRVQYVEIAPDKKTVRFYYDLSNTPGTPAPLELKGAQAQSFVADLLTVFN
jgi:hypothetical protein